MVTGDRVAGCHAYKRKMNKVDDIHARVEYWLCKDSGIYSKEGQTEGLPRRVF